MLMATNLYDNAHSRNEHYLEFVTAHEVGHQWFYGLVGSNPHRAAFIDEGLAEYLSTEAYFTVAFGPEVARRQFGLEVLMWYLGALEARGDPIVDQPTDDFANSAVYGAAVYAKAAIGFAEINDLVGDDAFFTALRQYASDYELGIATPDALLQALASASELDVATTWTEWFETASGRERFSADDFQELQVELGLR
jgi:aminopeptidase N